MIWPFLKTPFAGAQTTLFAALDPSLDKISGLYFGDCGKADISEEARNPELSDWLWKVSEKWTGLNGDIKQKAN